MAGKKQAAAQYEKEDDVFDTSDKPVVVLSTVNGFDVSNNDPADISPPPTPTTWLVVGTVSYPDSLGVPHFNVQIMGTRQVPEGTAPNAISFSNVTGTTLKNATFTFPLVSADILMNGDFTLIVEANNSGPGGGGTIVGGKGGDDASLHVTGFSGGGGPPILPPIKPIV